MEGLLVGSVIALAVISRQLDVRLWRAGKISDRTLAIVALVRFPILTFVLGLVVGAPLPMLLGITALAVLPGLLFYRFMLGVIRDQAALRRSA